MTTRSSWVIDPDTGHKIKKNSYEYNRLVEDGRLSDPTKLPNVEKFIYVENNTPNEGTWIRIGSATYSWYRDQLDYIPFHGMLVKKNLYRVGEVETEKIKKEISKFMVQTRDILGSILARACDGDLRTYCRIRATNKRFKDVIDEYVSYDNLIQSLCIGKTTLNVQGMPRKAVISFVCLYPDMFITTCCVCIWACKIFCELMGTEEHRKYLNGEALKLLNSMSEQRKYLYYPKVKVMIAQMDIPEDMKKKELRMISGNMTIGKILKDIEINPPTILIPSVSKARKYIIKRRCKNPKTGRYIVIGGPTYNKLIESGVIDSKQLLNVVPNIDEFVYFGYEDKWIHKDSLLYKSMTKGKQCNYIKVDGQLVIKSVYEKRQKKKEKKNEKEK